MDHHRAVELLRYRRLLVSAQVVAPVDRKALGLELRDSIVVADARERLHHAFELADVAFEHLQLRAAPFQHPGHDVGDEILGQVHVVVQFEKSRLRLHHPELRQMAPGLGLFGAEGRPEAVNLAEGERTGFRIKLTALGQIGLALAEIIDLEKVGGAFAGRRREHRRIEQHKAALVEEIAAGGLDFTANPQDRVLA